MFRSSKFFLFGWLVVWAATAAAQQLQIQFPQEGQEVRGEIAMRYSGIPDGGYVIVKVDGNWVTATAERSFSLNTFDIKALSPNLPNEGKHAVTLVAIDAGGKKVEEKTVSFVVANTRVDMSSEGVKLRHYEDFMRLDPNVQRYRVFAESNATESGGASGGGGGGGEGGEGAGPDTIPAPYDWQVSALMRRIVRDVGGWSDTVLGDDKTKFLSSANIRTVVQEAYQRQREGESGSGQGEGMEGGANEKPKLTIKKQKVSSGPTKAPWQKNWEVAPEIGQYFVKNIEPNGREINATRKAPTIALADLLPSFPEEEVRPGSTWETRMTFLGDLSSRAPVNVSVPITFTSFEDIQTPAGFKRRAAKLESRFQMPELVAKKMAINLMLKSGGGASGGGEEGGAPTGDSVSTMSPEDLEVYLESILGVTSRGSRVLWFDVENHRVLRSEDVIRTSFQYQQVTQEGGGDSDSSNTGEESGAAQTSQSEPTKISYNLSVTTWLDDTVPGVHPKYTGGAGTAHARDNATDPTIERINKPVAP